MPVYFVQAGETGPVKIGWATDPRARIADLQTGHYERLRLIRIIEGDRLHERWLHVHFRGHRLQREWFAFCQDMLSVMPPSVVLDLPALRRGTLPADAQWVFIEELGLRLGAKPDAVRKWRVRGVPHRWRLPIASAAGAGFDPSIFDVPPGPRRASSREAA